MTDGNKDLHRYDGADDAEAWVCSIAWEEELGRTDVTLYESEAALKTARKCCNGPGAHDPEYGDEFICRPVKVKVTRA